MSEVNPHIGILYLDLFIGDAQSLKQKRMVLKRLKDKVRLKFNVSISELEGQDKWQISTMGFAMLGTDQRYMDQTLQNLILYIDHFHAVEISNHEIEFL